MEGVGAVERVPQLVATTGPLKGQRFTVTETGLVVGRDSVCDVIIPDTGVSRQHARVRLHNSAVWVQDEGSRNGVFVNGKRVVRHRQFSPGAEMSIGEHSFTIEMVSPFSDHPSVSVIRVAKEAEFPSSDEKDPIKLVVLAAIPLCFLVLAIAMLLYAGWL